jgi:hypothetical protein
MTHAPNERGTMQLKNVLTATAAILIFSSAAGAAQTPTRINQFNAWGTYSYDDTGGKVCYILSTPTQMSPASVNHGDIFFLVSQKPGQGVSYEPQVVMGYPLQEGSKVTVDVDGKDYTMFVKGESAWMENAAEEPQLVAALKAGRSMKVDATSQRGTATSYTYSLSGVTAALNSINECR